MIKCLSTTLRKFTSPYAEIRSVVVILRTELNRKFGQIEYNSHAALNTLLDTRFKNINFRDSIACGQAILKLRNLIKKDTLKLSSESEVTEKFPMLGRPCGHLSVFTHFYFEKQSVRGMGIYSYYISSVV